MSENNNNVDTNIFFKQSMEKEKDQNEKKFNEQIKGLDRIDKIFKKNKLVKEDLIKICKDLKPLRHFPELFEELKSEGFYLEQKEEFQYSTKYDLHIKLVEFLSPQFPIDLSLKKITIGSYAAEILPLILEQLKLNLEQDSKGLVYVMALEELSKYTGEEINNIKGVIGSIDAYSKFFKFFLIDNKEYVRLEGFNLCKLFDFFKRNTITKNLIKHLIIVSLFYNVDPNGRDYANHFNLILSYNTCALVAVGYLYTIKNFSPSDVKRLYKKAIQKIIKKLYKPVASEYGAGLTKLMDTRNISLFHSFCARNENNMINESFSLIIKNESELDKFINKILVPLVRRQIGMLRIYQKERDAQRQRW